MRRRDQACREEGRGYPGPMANEPMGSDAMRSDAMGSEAIGDDAEPGDATAGAAPGRPVHEVLVWSDYI